MHQEFAPVGGGRFGADETVGEKLLDRLGRRLVRDSSTVCQLGRGLRPASVEVPQNGGLFDAELIAAALDARPELRVYGTASVAATLGSHGGRVRTVTADYAFAVGSFSVTVHGRRHALIHPDIPCPDNVGYLVDAALYHPGDAYFVPDASVRTLLLPTSGPWTKLGEAADFVRAVQPDRIVQTHD
ncbi:MBL fold metallo-hydrolase [Streptomyces phaeoluteigriseus]|uniref:MBL fold metallo-hydrolase n=1 Tax=Streptomyces phaeoluteigriseus TaxID=114686 RepID=UPI003CCC08F8